MAGELGSLMAGPGSAAAGRRGMSVRSPREIQELPGQVDRLVPVESGELCRLLDVVVHHLLGAPAADPDSAPASAGGLGAQRLHLTLARTSVRISVPVSRKRGARTW